MPVRPLSLWERVGVRGYGLSSERRPLTRFAQRHASHRSEQIDLSPTGRSEPSLRIDRRDNETSLIRSSAGVLLALAVALPLVARADGLQSHMVVGDGFPDSLTGLPGDAVRGRALVLDRASTCILCHSGPFPETRFQGDLAPSLAGAGNRWSESQLRLRLVDASRFNPDTIMPSYYRVDGLQRVGKNWQGKPILSAEQIEDIVAYLVSLRE